MLNSIFSLRSFFYLIYAVILTAVLLYVRFPVEKVKVFCEQRIEHLVPDSACSIDSMKYNPPLSAALNNIKITKVTDGKSSEMIVNRLAISPEPLKFWKVFKLSGEVYSGQFAAELNRDIGTKTFQLKDIHFTNIDGGQLAEGLGLIDRKVSGNVEFTGNYQAQNSMPLRGTGEGTALVVAGNMELLQPILSFSTLEFETVEIGTTYENGLLNFAEGKLVGKEIKADFIGGMRLMSPFVNSSLLLNGHLEPQDNYLKSHPQEQKTVQRLLQRYKVNVLPFKVGGTVKRPLFRFST